MKRQILLLLGLLFLMVSCTKEPKDYPPEPQIYYQTMTPNVVDLNDSNTKVIIELKFTDGDGDIGNDEGTTRRNIFLKDSRDTSKESYTYQYPFPYIPPSMRPSKGGLEGFIAINLGKQYFSITDSLHLALRKDTLRFTIYVEDEAKNRSNLVNTDSIYIQF